MTIKTHNKISLGIAQIIDRHIQMHCVLIKIEIPTFKITKY